MRAFLFPGQGSQYPGMGKDLYEKCESLRPIFESADAISGLGVTEAMFTGPEEALKQTQITQPALYTHSAAVHTFLKEKGITAEFFAGHSLGEFSALAAAGVFSVEDGMKLVAKRGSLMSQARKGTMAAIIGLDDDTVIAICKGVENVWPANFNCEGRIVISGSPEGIEKACAKAKESGAKRALPLPVSGAFHTPFMQQAADEFRSFLDGFEFKPPKGKVIPNVTGEVTDDPGLIKDLLARQLTSPVLWTKTMSTLVSLGITEIYELGAGKVLTGLAKRGIPNASLIPVGTLEEITTLFA